MSTSVMTAATPPQKRPRPSGPRKQGPRQHLPSLARSTMSPAPQSPRLVRNSPAPAEKTGQTRVCLNKDCPGSDIVEDDMGGGLVCRACGTVLNESNIVAENQWIENPGGVAGMAGQFVGGNQAAPRTITGMRNRGAYGPGHEGTDSRYQSEQKARATMKTLIPIGINDNLMEQGVQIYKLAVQHGLLHGRTIELVAAVSVYVACRRNPKSNTVMLIDIADQLNINLFVLGSLYQKMVEKLKGIGGTFTTTIEPVNPESLINRFADHLEFGSDKIKIIRDAVHIFKRMKRDWIADGRRPAGVAAASILLAARMNNYHRTVREMVLHAKMTEITINRRLWEFSNTVAAEWRVDEFRKVARQEAEGAQWEGSDLAGVPPAYYMQQVGAPKRPRGRPRKNPRPEAVEVDAAEAGGSVEEQVEEEAEGDEDEHEDEETDEQSVIDEPPAKRARIDADGFKVPFLPQAISIKPKPRIQIDTSSHKSTMPLQSEAAFSGPSSSDHLTTEQRDADMIDVGQSQFNAEPSSSFAADHLGDATMITDGQPQFPTESSITALDAQQKMKILDSMEEDARRAKELGVSGIIRPPLTIEEKNRRISNDLCLYCGSPRHNHHRCGAAVSAEKFKRALKEKERQAALGSEERGIPSIKLTPFLRQDTLAGSTLGEGTFAGSTLGGSTLAGSTLGDDFSTFGDDAQSTVVGTDDLETLNSGSVQRSASRSQTPSSTTGGKRRGRPKGWKQKPTPAETAAELEIESALTDDLEYALNYSADPADKAHLIKEIGVFSPPATNATVASESAETMSSSSPSVAPPLDSTPPLSNEAIALTSEISAATNAITAATNALQSQTPAATPTLIPQGGLPARSTIGDTGTISLSPTLSATEFDDDPEVNACLLTANEAAMKEKIWVTENAEWLRKHHYKRIQKELREAAMIAEGRDPEEEAKKKKGRRLGVAPYMEAVKQRRKERLSATPAGSEPSADEQARLDAAEATYEMVNHKARTAFSRRFNQQSMDDIWGDLASDPSSPSMSRPSISQSPPIANLPGSTAGSPLARNKGRLSAVSIATTSPASLFQAPDEDGPLGPSHGRSPKSLGASKREAKRWAALRKEKEALGIPQKVSLASAAIMSPERWGSAAAAARAEGSGSPAPLPAGGLPGVSVAAPLLSHASARRRPAKPRPQAARKRNAAANATLTLSRPGSVADSTSTSNPLAGIEEAIGSVDGGTVDEDDDVGVGASASAGIAAQGDIAQNEDQEDPDEEISDEDDDDEDEDDEDDDDDQDIDEEDPEDALAGRVRRRSSTGSDDSD